MQTFDALPALTARDAWQLAANSFEASFADDAHKAQWRQQLDAAFSDASRQGMNRKDYRPANRLRRLTAHC